MSGAMISIAVVGHTNTGKTSLMRTLLRDAAFGEVSDRPGVTRRVEGALLLVDGRPVVELFDTPGLEDSIRLLDALNDQQSDRATPPIEIIRNFIDDRAASSQFNQECEVLRQVLRSELVLYVVDARDRVLGKHRDELEILRRCARPVVPVLNFVAYDEARLDEWRQALSHSGLHAIAEFDTVVFDATDEQRLFEKWRILLDESRGVIDALIESRRKDRRRLIDDSLGVIADLLIDAAACVRVIPFAEAKEDSPGVRVFRRIVQSREQRCAQQLLELHRFDPELWNGIELPIEEGRWGLDLFSPEALKQFGIRTGAAAGAGALAGLGVDALLGGLSLGAATATGAAIGAIWSTAASHGRRVIDRTRGLSELRCDNATLHLLAARAVAVLEALLSRGHASVTPLDAAPSGDRKGSRLSKSLFAIARAHPEWSSLNDAADGDLAAPGRAKLRRRVVDGLAVRLRTAPSEP